MPLTEGRREKRLVLSGGNLVMPERHKAEALRQPGLRFHFLRYVARLQVTGVGLLPAGSPEHPWLQRVSEVLHAGKGGWGPA